jgi:hypothetical protein
MSALVDDSGSENKSDVATNKKRQALQPAAVIENNGEPWRARTSDPLIKSSKEAVFLNTSILASAFPIAILIIVVV